jgi:hypothetical protein
MEERDFVLTRRLDAALSDAMARDPSLESVCDKLNCVFEAYALSIGTVKAKLRVLDICNELADISKPLRRFVYNVYPASDKYKGEINSRIKKIIRALTGAEEEQIKRGEFSVLIENVPEYMRPMLVHLARERPEGPPRAKSDDEARLQWPLTEAGLRYLSACIDVHRKYQPLTLEALLCEHSVSVLNSLESLFGKKACSTLARFNTGIRKRLGMELPDKQTVTLSREFWPSTLRAEWEVYIKKAVTDGSGDRELADVEDFGFKVGAVRQSTVESRESTMGIALGYIVPHALSLGMEDFGVEDLLKIEHGERIYNSLKIPHDFNTLVEYYRQCEKSRSSDRKRSNRDSVSFEAFLSAIKRLGIYTGKAHLVESFGNAYRKQMRDTDTTEARKALRLASYPCVLVDDRIERLSQKFDETIKSGAFRKEPDKRNLNDADAAFNFCVYYPALLVLRYLGYRQQALRDCKVGENITFNRDGSITFFWPKDKVKNKKPIKVVLDAKKRPYQKRLVSALWSYYRNVYPYIRQWSAHRGNLGLIDNQFFIHTNVHAEYECFPKGRRGGNILYRWWTYLSESHLEFDELGIENRLPFNPHFLRALCINWMKDVLGLSDEEIAEAVGDTVKVVRAAYISRERVVDATRVTDRIAEILQKREEKEVGLNEQLKLEEEKHKAEVIVFQQEKAEFKQAVEQAQKRIIALEAEAAASRAARAGDQATIREQAILIGELATRLSDLTASDDAIKKRRAKVS